MRWRTMARRTVAPRRAVGRRLEVNIPLRESTAPRRPPDHRSRGTRWAGRRAEHPRDHAVEHRPAIDGEHALSRVREPLAAQRSEATPNRDGWRTGPAASPVYRLPVREAHPVCYQSGHIRPSPALRRRLTPVADAIIGPIPGTRPTALTRQRASWRAAPAALAQASASVHDGLVPDPSVPLCPVAAVVSRRCVNASRRSCGGSDTLGG